MLSGNKFAIPVALGLFAALMQYNYIKGKVKLYDFILIKRPIQVGERVTEDAIEKIQLPGEFKRIGRSLVPYAEKAQIIDSIAQRKLLSGDVLFFQDTDYEGKYKGPSRGKMLMTIRLEGVSAESKLIEPGTVLEFVIANEKQETGSELDFKSIETLGPYKVTFVGAQHKDDKTYNEKEGDDRKRNNDKNISVEVGMDDFGKPDARSKKLEQANLQRRIVSIHILNPDDISKDDESDTMETE
jgi:hypothetical protein